MKNLIKLRQQACSLHREAKKKHQNFFSKYLERRRGLTEAKKMEKEKTFILTLKINIKKIHYDLFSFLFLIHATTNLAEIRIKEKAILVFLNFSVHNRYRLTWGEKQWEEKSINQTIIENTFAYMQQIFMFSTFYEKFSPIEAMIYNKCF